jgi:hypothetical protein
MISETIPFAGRFWNTISAAGLANNYVSDELIDWLEEHDIKCTVQRARSPNTNEVRLWISFNTIRDELLFRMSQFY